MKFSAAYRSIIETITVIILTGILNDEAFASFMSGIYPIYFVANLLFSSSTVDFAGGQRQAQLSSVLLIIALPMVLLFAIVQSENFRSIYYLIAGLTAIESVAFVACESTAKRTALLIMLAPRAMFATGIGMFFMLGSNLSLEATIQILFVRDLALVLIGATVLFLLRREFSFRIGHFGLKMGEVTYLLISNANDFVLRVAISKLLGPAFLKEFEYALRLPKIAQVGLMLILRHQIFIQEVVLVRSLRMLQLHFAAAACSAVIFFNYLVGFFTPLSLIAASALLATSAVPWYAKMLRGRKFAILTTAQILSFGATVMSAVIFADAYVSTFFLALILFLFSFVNEIRNGRQRI